MTASQRTPPPADVTMLLRDHRWQAVDPANPGGPAITALWGDPASGPYGALLRVPAGFESPLHRHSSDERVIVISGSSVHWVEGQSRETATILRAGDFLMMPAGVNHVSAAASNDEDCLEFITMDGKFDFELA
jgi:mannose-6-phosphate isomerase-like protein (cupin superfamily)